MRAFCASLPKPTTGCRPKTLICTEDTTAMPLRPICRITSAASETPGPAPPCSFGAEMPYQPPRAIRAARSCGKAPSRSRASQ